jgi:hypothetical protein
MMTTLAIVSLLTVFSEISEITMNNLQLSWLGLIRGKILPWDDY